MRWGGETLEQYVDRVTKWHRVFALLPEQMTEGEDAGTWIWLEHYERRILVNQMRTRMITERRTLGTPDRPTPRHVATTPCPKEK